MKTDTAPQSAPKKIFLKDYAKPDYLVEHVSLTFALDKTKTRVTARLSIKRNEGVSNNAPLVLNGEDLDLVSIAIDGQALGEDTYAYEHNLLTVKEVPASFTLETEVIVNPDANTKLSGLYISNGMFCTQCEAEGFRRITFFPDRPDVLSTYDVRIEADKSAYPVLLANGNPGDKGDLDHGRHYAEWADPHPKPAYLFALVGGDLAHKQDSFTTMSGREVTLQIFVQPHNLDKTDYALDALKRSMKWDEETFGREYDLDIFMIVAVDHFNFGAMENKGLNIFNSSCVLASETTATDGDFELIESIVAHEYFHNWSGNRVTCRDWFQLCLKEGFTVFRDQEFTADQRSRAVARIRDVRRLWQRQFQEDAGPLAHPVRPESYITIDNFYTATVYDKGAELVRMMKTLLGPEDFRKATDLYFEKNDGTAATVEDFVGAMEEASGLDLTQFRRWYADAGTPKIEAKETWDNGTYALTLTQHTDQTPGQDEKAPRHIPVRMGLIGPDGPMVDEKVLELTEESQTFTFDGLQSKPVASLFRGFSAPVTIKRDLDTEERLQLIAQDTDSFNRWATAHAFAMDLLKSMAGQQEMENTHEALISYAKAIETIISDETLEPAFRAEVLRVPTETDIGRAVSHIDPDAIAEARRKFRRGLLETLRGTLSDLYKANMVTDEYDPGADQAGKRALKNAALALMMAEPSDATVDLALKQAEDATNMTDEAGAVSLLAQSDRPEREGALSRFYDKWKHDPLVVNKWLVWQALAGGEDALEKIIELTKHEAFDMGNPNKVRSLIGAFAMENPKAFHRADGAGYDFFFEKVRELDKRNPQVAARLLTATESWRKLEPKRREMLGSRLKALSQEDGLSNNTFEMAERLSD